MNGPSLRWQFAQRHAGVRPVVAGLTGMVDQEYGVAVMWIFGFIAHITAAALLFDALTKGWGQSGAADAQRGERSSAAPEQ